MADDKMKRAPQDAKLISLKEDYEAELEQEVDVSREQLADALKAVGASAKKVGGHLKRRLPLGEPGPLPG